MELLNAIPHSPKLQYLRIHLTKVKIVKFNKITKNPKKINKFKTYTI